MELRKAVCRRDVRRLFRRHRHLKAAPIAPGLRLQRTMELPRNLLDREGRRGCKFQWNGTEPMTMLDTTSYEPNHQYTCG